MPRLQPSYVDLVHQSQDLIEVERFGQVAVDAQLEREGAHRDGGRHHDHRQVNPLLVQGSQQGLTIHGRHVHIEEKEIRVLLLHQSEGLDAVGCGEDGVSFHRQGIGQGFAYRLVVIDDQDRECRFGHHSSRSRRAEGRTRGSR